ncbi:MAG: hypothetical protein EP329_01900 [Deltaproteobacteria bacterium]|nr:MAG: hypothetical protein EP329_01900 [Deltaproteobacteria bacterium]
MVSGHPKVVVVRQHREAGGMPESVVKGMRALGVDVTMVHYAQVLGGLTAIKGPAAGLIYETATEVARPLTDALLVAEIARLRPDLVLVFKTDGLPAATYWVLKLATKAKIAVFHPDDPFNVGRRVWLKRRGGPAHRRSRVAMRQADLYLTWSQDLMRRATAAGARDVRFMPFGCDPELHPRVDAAEVPDELKADVVFIGSWDPERERWLKALAAMEGVDFALWGASWDTHCKDPALLRAWRRRPLFGREMSQAVAGGKIHVNILRAQNKHAHNMRTFEIPCAGGFMLHERSAEAAEMLPPGEACDDFGTPEELCDKVRHYLDAPDARTRIAERGYELARTFSYTSWAERVLELTLG